MNKAIINYLKKKGFKKIKVPSGPPPDRIIRWICNKVPYSSAISEFRIDDIVDIVTLQAKKEVFDDIDKCNPMLKIYLKLHADFQRVKSKHLSTTNTEKLKEDD